MTALEDRTDIPDSGDGLEPPPSTIIAAILGIRHRQTGVRIMSCRTPDMLPIFHDGRLVAHSHNPTVVWLPDHHCAAITVTTNWTPPTDATSIDPELAGGTVTLAGPDYQTDVYDTEIVALHTCTHNPWTNR